LPSGLAGSIHPTFIVQRPGGAASPANSSSPVGFTPQQIRHAYGIDQTPLPNGIQGDGTGQTIAIVDAYDDPRFVSSTDPNFVNSDLHQFDLQFGLPDPPSFKKVDQNGGTNYPGTDPGDPSTSPPRLPGTWETEIALDVEWAHAVAPGASILLVEANSGSDLYTAVTCAAVVPGVSVVSMSWGGPETPGETSSDSFFLTRAGHIPTTFVASSGDVGALPLYPAMSPNVLAVGGTVLSVDAANNYLGETGWGNNGTVPGGSGGGFSRFEPLPAYQTNAGISSTLTQFGVRLNPDVAYNAGAGVAVFDSFNNPSSQPWSSIGGTSAGAPQWAALIAIADQGRAQTGLPTLDSSTTLGTLYQLDSSAFHDITTGNNGFPAGPGYDLVTGLGSPVANLIVPGLAGMFSNSNGNLVVHGDRLGATPETITVDETPAGGVSVSLNGHTAQFGPGKVRLISLYTGSGSNTVNVRATLASAPLVILGGGSDTVTIGAAGSVQAIHGEVDVLNLHGGTALTVDDRADATARTVVLDNGTLDGLAPARIVWWTSPSGGSVTGLTVYGGRGGNTFTVNNTTRFSGVTVLHSGTGSDRVNVKGTTGSLIIDGDNGSDSVSIGSQAPSLGGTLTNVTGAVTVSNTSGHTTLVADDSGDATARTVTITSNAVTGLGPASINFADGQVSSLDVYGGRGGNTFNVLGTAASTSVDIDSGAGNDAVNVRASAGSLAINGDSGNDVVTLGSQAPSLGGTLTNISGTVNVSNSNTGHTALVLDDSGDTVGRAVSISPNAVTGLAPGAIDYVPGQVSSLQVNGGSGNDAFTIAGLPAIPVAVNGGGGANTLVGPNAANAWVVNAANGGTLGTVTFASVQNLRGGSGVDTFRLLSTGSLAGSINGGGAPAGQGNWLDYSARPTGANVDLTNGTATSVTGGVSNIQNVLGGQGSNVLRGNALGNVLVGGAGNDLLIGGSGRNFLIGGAGSDTITGGSSDDILIGGTTSFSANEAALMAILAEWQRPIPFSQRVADLTTGVGPGGSVQLVWGKTVLDDGVPDTIQGGGGMDWIFS
jgi:Ca2+-binding RTX toxin-like protein